MSLVGIVLLLGGVVAGTAGAIAAVLAGRRARVRIEALSAERAAAEARAREALSERDRVVAALLETRDGVVVADASGRIVVRSRAAARYHGARHSEAIAEDLLGRLLQRALAGDVAEQELSLFGPPRATLVVRAVPLEVDGIRIGAAAFVHDVTELRRVEQVRRDFVANVTHELKTPIGALQLLAETLFTCDDPDVQRRFVAQLVGEADRLGRIVDDLLDLSLIEADEAPVRERVPVRVLVSEAVERVRALALARGIPLRVAPIDGDLVVDCDATRVVGALTNLLDNAVKYSDPGGEVEIEAVAEGDRVVTSVTDHGIGIPASDLERVFERFYRVDKARSRATGGTGLGLSIVRHVAHAHGGEVTVSSREGVGSTFRLALPAVPPTPARRDTAEAAAEAGGP